MRVLRPGDPFEHTLDQLLIDAADDHQDDHDAHLALLIGQAVKTALTDLLFEVGVLKKVT
jgi:hypothetical protein